MNSSKKTCQDEGDDTMIDDEDDAIVITSTIRSENREDKLAQSSTSANIVTPMQTQMPTQMATQLAIASRKEKVLKFDLNELKKSQLEKQMRKIKELEEKEKDEEELIRELKFKVRNIESKEADVELQRSLTKADFALMKVKGQFNKGNNTNIISPDFGFISKLNILKLTRFYCDSTGWRPIHCRSARSR